MKIKYLGIVIFLGIMAYVISFGFKTPSYYPVLYYNSSGLVNQTMKHWEDSVSPSGSASQTINISSAGFNKIINVSLTAKNNTVTVANIPIVELETYTTSQVTYNFLTSNTTTISILGVNVVGLQLPASVPTGTVVYCSVDGY